MKYLAWLEGSVFHDIASIKKFPNIKLLNIAQPLFIANFWVKSISYVHFPIHAVLKVKRSIIYVKSVLMFCTVL